MGRLVFYVCDRCACEEPRDDGANRTRWSSHLVTVGPATTKTVDLCPACTRELMTWLDGKSAPAREIERASLAERLQSQLLDEVPTNRDPDPMAMARDAGYRAGWNDRARSLVKELQS